MSGPPAGPGEAALAPRAVALERAVVAVLRAGVTLSSLLILAGGVITLVSSTTRVSARKAFGQVRRGALHPASLQGPHTVATVVSGSGHGDGPALVMLGVLLLIATPVLRVAVSVIGFGIGRDRRFVLITLVVLAVLIGSFAVGT